MKLNLWDRIVLSPDEGSGDPPPAPDPDVDATPPAADPPKEPGDSTLITKKEAEPPEPAAEPLTNEDLTIPEGMEVADEVRDQFLGVLNDSTLSRKDLAAALLNLQAETMKAAFERSSELLGQQQSEWVDQTKALPELGGKNLDRTLAGVRRLLDEFGTPELDAAFDQTGLGDHPEMVKFLHTLADKFGEAETPASGEPSASNKSLAERLFPNQDKAA